MTGGEKIPTSMAQVIDAGGDKARYDAEAKQFKKLGSFPTVIMER